MISLNIGNVFILGDSYSTFEGHIPDGYDSWYYSEIKKDTDVSNVNQTWWKQLLNETQANLVLNCSWSGTTICNAGYNGDNTHNSFITRFDKLAEKGFFKENKIDTLFIFGGTNDTWANSPVGELEYANWDKQSLFSVLPAFCYLLNRVGETCPLSRVICIINTDLKQEIVEGMKTACERYCAEYVELIDIDKQSGHPNKAGMAKIKEQILHYLQKSVAKSD